MATERNRIALANTQNYYTNAKKLNSKIVLLVRKFREVDEDGKHDIIDDITICLKDLQKFTNKINITIIERTFPGAIAIEANKNIAGFKHNILYVEKFLLGNKYFDSTIYNIEVLVDKADFNRHEYYQYADDEKELAHKIGEVLTDPKYVIAYKPILTKIANGRMDLEEFKKLFYSIQEKMAGGDDDMSESFVSFSNFKKTLNREV